MTSVENLRGGSANDTFRFALNGSNIGQLSGGIDGGLGTDTVTYDNSNWWRFAPYDLSIGRLPLAAGISSSIERAPFDVNLPANQATPVGQTITPLAMTRYGGPLSVTWTITNLPAGLTYDTQTGVINGTISPQAAGNRTVTAQATDGTYSGSRTFTWTLQGPTVTNPGTQTNALGSAVNLALTSSGGSLTYSASNLPAGLSINPQTGVISGTVAAQAAGNRTTTVSVFDGINTGSANFLWTLTAHTLTSPGDQTFDVGETISPISVAANNAAVPLTWSATGLPSGTTINEQTGVISGTIINQSGAVGSHAVTVFATDGFNVRFVSFAFNVEDAPSLQGDFNLDGSVDVADFVMWAKLGMSTGQYITWQQNFGETTQTGSGGSAAATIPNSNETFLTHTAFSAEAPRRDTQFPFALGESEPPLIDGQSSEGRSGSLDFLLYSLQSVGRVGRTSAAVSRTFDPAVPDATDRDDLLALVQAVHAADQPLVTRTAFDVDWRDTNDVEVDDFDIPAIDHAFEELNLLTDVGP
jgi:hypothetical protein